MNRGSITGGKGDERNWIKDEGTERWVDMR